MRWTSPKVVEIPVGMEINAYACAELEAASGTAVRVLVLGAAAGGGFPQWNSNSEAARRARAGDPHARPSTQSSLAVSADGERWLLLNASPDIRQQIEANPPLHPRHGVRHSPIEAVVLTNGDGRSEEHTYELQ